MDPVIRASAPRDGEQASPPASPKEGLIGDLFVLRDCLLTAGLRPSSFAVPVLLALGVALFEALGVWLLIPLTQGIMTADYGFLRDVPAVRRIIPFLPNGQDVSGGTLFAGLVLTVFAVFVAKNFMQYGSSASVALIVRRFANNMRKLLFARCLTFGKLFFDRTNSGYLQGVLINHTDKLATRLSDLQQFFTQLFTCAAYLAVMLKISVKLTLIVFVLFPVMHYSFEWLMQQLRLASQSFAGSQGDLSRKISNVLSCRPLVKANAMEGRELAAMGEISDRVEKFEFSIDRRVLLILPIQEIIVMALILFLISTMALIVKTQGPVRIPSFLIFFYVLRRAAVSFGQMTNMKASLATVTGPLSEIQSLLNGAGKHVVEEGTRSFPGLSSEIRCVGLRFSYSSDKVALSGVDMTIRKGRTTAVVGPSGAGKTTIISLLSRFYDCPPGSILVDGEDIRGFSLSSLAPHIALVGQDTLLFDDTLRNNITYGLDGAASEARLQDIARRARIAELASTLPKGFDTPVGERGVQLSGGEKQRVSIARAMLKDAEILILDEATSSLDSATERLIQEAIDEMLKGRTAIIIAHRLSTIKRADNIVVLDGGKVVEEGSLPELLARQGLFHRLWEAQKFD